MKTSSVLCESGLFNPPQIPNVSTTLDTLHVRQLRLDDMKYIQELQEAVLDDIVEKHGKEQTIIHIKNEETFKKKLTKPNYMFGIFERNTLIAQSCIYREEVDIPEALQENMDRTLYTVEGVLVHPDYRGRGLMKHLINISVAKAQEEGVHTLSAEVDIHNPASFSNFLKRGFIIGDIYVDPSDKGETYRLYRSLNSEIRLTPQAGRDVKTNFKSLRESLESGMCGVAYNRRNDKIRMKQISIRGRDKNVEVSI